MRILALDQSLQTTGWAIFDNQTLTCFHHWNIASNRPIELRLNEIWSNLNVLAGKESEDHFDKIYFEDIQMQRGNAATFKQLAYVQAAIMMWCYNNNYKFEIMPASHWRKVIKDNFGVIFGRSRADQKAAAQAFVEKKFQVKATEDEADAILIGLAAVSDKSSEVIEF